MRVLSRFSTFPSCVLFALFALMLLMDARVVMAGVSNADEAVRQVESASRGRVLSIQPASGGYRVKIQTRDGVVRNVFVAGERGEREGADSGENHGASDLREETSVRRESGRLNEQSGSHRNRRSDAFERGRARER